TPWGWPLTASAGQPTMVREEIGEAHRSRPAVGFLSPWRRCMVAPEKRQQTIPAPLAEIRSGASRDPLSRGTRMSGTVILILLCTAVFVGLTAHLLYPKLFHLKADQDLVAELLNLPTLGAADDKDDRAAKPGEWPQWRGPNRDGVSSETGVLTNWPKEGPKVLWKAKASVGFSSFAVAGGRGFTLLQDGPDAAVLFLHPPKGPQPFPPPHST